jgi:hypothetical protein
VEGAIVRPRLKTNDPQDIAEWVGASLDELHDRITDHVDKRTAEQNTLFLSAFPGGDAIEHRRAHEEQINRAAEKKALWKAVREKTMAGGVWAGLAFLALAALDSVKGMLHR